MFPRSGVAGIGNRAQGERDRDPPPIIGARVQVGERLDIRHGRADGVATERLLESSLTPTSSASPTESSRRGQAVAAPTPTAKRRQRPWSSSATCAAAATKAKSLRRALTSWKPTPIR